MMDAAALRSGKTHRDENFPVARLVAARHRGVILAFYDFVRTADDIADHPSLSEASKLEGLASLEASLLGQADDQAVGVALRERLRARGLSERHALDLLAAFRQDVTKRRYADWDELIAYCALSAMPVGRFVLDVHGESRSTWAASDPLCAALQIINHLQDCGQDFARLDRVYVPLDALAAAGAEVADLGRSQATPALRRCLADLAHRTRALVDQGAALPRLTRDARLGVECAIIHRVAERLTDLLTLRDPLSEPVHFGKAAFLRLAAGAALREGVARIAPGRGRPFSGEAA